MNNEETDKRETTTARLHEGQGPFKLDDNSTCAALEQHTQTAKGSTFYQHAARSGPAGLAVKSAVNVPDLPLEFGGGLQCKRLETTTYR